MAVDLMFGYPSRCIMQDYEPETTAGIDAGMFVEIDGTSKKLKKATGGANTYAMLAMSKQPSNFLEQGGKITCVKENGAFYTSYYNGTITSALAPHTKLVVAGEGILAANGTATSGIVGRFEGMIVRNGVTMAGFTLVRS